MNLFVSRVSVRKDFNDIPEMFIVVVYSNNAEVDGLYVDFSITVDIPFNESLSFSEIESLAVARVRAFIAQ